MPSRFKLTCIVLLSSMFNVGVSLLAYSLFFAPTGIEHFGHSGQSISISPAVIYEETAPSVELPPLSEFSLPPLPQDNHLSPESLIPNQILEQILSGALTDNTPLPEDKSSLSEQGLFSAPGPKKNLI